METIDLIKQARSGDKIAREQVIKDNMALVYSIVRRFTGRGYDPEDLGQIGAIGLIKAVDKFDLNYNVQFSTYAVPMITGEIKRFLRDDGMVKVSRSLKRLEGKEGGGAPGGRTGPGGHGGGTVRRDRDGKGRTGHGAGGGKRGGISQQDDFSEGGKRDCADG